MPPRKAPHAPAIAAVVALLASTAGCEETVVPQGGGFECIGLPSSKCQEFLDSAEVSVPQGVPVSARIACTAGTCTEDNGSADVLIVFADGQRIEYGVGWSAEFAPVPAPAQPAPAEPAGPSPAPIDAGPASPG